MNRRTLFRQTAWASLFLGSFMSPALAQELIPATAAGDVMGKYFCLETTGQLSPDESNNRVQEDLVSVYGVDSTLVSMERLAVLDESTDAALEDPYAFEVLRQMMRYAIEDDACFRATFFGL